MSDQGVSQLCFVLFLFLREREKVYIRDFFGFKLSEDWVGLFEGKIGVHQSHFLCQVTLSGHLRYFEVKHQRDKF
jgi:hypothetical protein